ncbi:MAG TPA: TonB-dependent receptor [Candidatus Kryptonia bacterium]
MRDSVTKKTNLIIYSVLLFGLAFVVSPAESQPRTYTLRGTVVDSSTGERIPYATVRVDSTTIGTASNAAGYFILPLIPYHSRHFVVSAVGFKRKNFEVESSLSVVEVTFRLPEEPPTMNPVLVTAEAVSQMKPASPSTFVLSPRELQKASGLLNNDLLQAVTQLPGVVTIGGISSQYYVRGGAADQNLVTIDGMRIYNLFHAFGLFSFVDPLIVKVADVSTGGFQAEYGGRLSSVLSIETRDGDKYNYGAAGSFDLLSSDIALYGPLPFNLFQGHTSFIGFFRTSLNRNTLNNFFNLNLPFQFYDGFGKFTTDFYSSGHVSLEYFSTGDQIVSSNNMDPDYHWRNSGYALTGNYFFGDDYNIQFSISKSVYRAEQLPKSSSYLYHQLSQISDPGVYGNLTYYPSPTAQLDFGLLFNFPTYEFTFTNAFGLPLAIDQTEAEPNFWLKYKWEFIRKLSIELGMRIDMARNFSYVMGGNHGYLGDPRATLTYKLDPASEVYLATGLYHQRVMNLNNENDIYTPFNLIIPISDATTHTDDEEAYHFILGGKGLLLDFLDVGTEVYYKDFTKLVLINRNKVDESDPDFILGTGESYGIELSAKYDIGIFYTMGNYSLAKVTNTSEGFTFAPTYDRRHQFNFSLGWEPLERLWLRTHWEYGSGLPYTPLAGYYPEMRINPADWVAYLLSNASSQVAFGATNSERISAYHRLDASGSYEFHLIGLDLTSELMLINIYNRKNVFYINNINGSVEYSLPFMVNVSLKWKI